MHDDSSGSDDSDFRGPRIAQLELAQLIKMSHSSIITDMLESAYEIEAGQTHR